MGGEETTKLTLLGAFWDAGQTPERVASGGKEEGEGVGGVQTGETDGRDDNGRTQQDRGGEDGGEKVEDAYGGFQLGEGGGACSDGVHGGTACGGVHMVGGGPDSQGEKGLPWHWACGGDVEGSGGNFKLPAHSLHRLPRLPPRILGGLRHRYRHPRGQTASAVSGLDGGGHVRDIYGPAQGV